MPTIDVPDKICPHCGGTKWYFHGGYIRTCFIKLSERRKAWRATDNGKAFMSSYHKTEAGKKHKEKYLNKESTVKLRAELAIKKYYRDKANNPDKLREYKKVNAAKSILKLTDSVIKRYIARDYSGIDYSDVPQELIELKRKQVLLTRKIKDYGKNNQNC